MALLFLSLPLFRSLTHLPPRSPLFPYTTLFRSLVNKGFTPRRVSQLEETIRRQTNEIIDSVAEKGEADFVTEMSASPFSRSEEHTSELQSLRHLVCRLLLEKKKTKTQQQLTTR